jgi:hypothetical protein
MGEAAAAAADEEAGRRSAPHSFVSPSFPLPLRGSCRRSRLRERAHRRGCICSHPGLSPSAARGAAPPSQREGGTNAEVSASLQPFASSAAARGTFPVGKVGGRPFAAICRRGATFPHALLSRGPRRARLPRAVLSKARICNHLRRQRVQGERRLCKKPLSLACLSSPPFCTSGKAESPEGGTPVPGGRYPRPRRAQPPSSIFHEKRGRAPESGSLLIPNA